MKKFTASLLALLFLFIACNKQDVKAPEDDQHESVPVITERSCALYQVLEAQMAADPGLAPGIAQIEAYTNKVLKSPGANRLAGSVIEIPVVVHVVYHSTIGNISDGRIASRIAVLNEDYQNTNTDKSKLPSKSFQSVASSGSNVRFVHAFNIIHENCTKTAIVFGTNYLNGVI